MTKIKNVKITLYGGFHNAPAVNVKIPDYACDCLEAGIETIQGVLSSQQLKRLNKHFCGVKGCHCGGVRRASWERYQKPK